MATPKTIASSSSSPAAVGAFTDALGNPYANGYLILKLESSSGSISGGGEVGHLPQVKISLDANGVPSPNQSIWASDQFASPVNAPYNVTVYNSSDLLVASLGRCIITGTQPIDLTTLTPTTTGFSLVNPLLVGTPIAGDILPDITNTRHVGNSALRWIGNFNDVNIDSAHTLSWGTDLFLSYGGTGVVDVGSSAGTSNGTVAATTFQSQIGSGVVKFGLNSGVSSPFAGVIAIGNGTAGDASGTLDARSVVLFGATSGDVVLAVPAAAGSNTATFPAATGNVVLDSATQTLSNKTLSNPTVTGTLTAATASFSDIISVTGNASLPTGTGSNVRWAGGFTSPVSGRLFIGDGTGWQLLFSKRSASVTTDLITFQDNGQITLTNQLIMPASSAATPAFKIGADQTGLYQSGAGLLDFTVAGTQRAELGAGTFSVIGGSPSIQLSGNSNPLLKFGTTTTAGITMTSASTLSVGNGAAADVSGTLQLTNIITAATGAIEFGSSGVATPDTFITRNGAGTIKLGSTNGASDGTLVTTNINLSGTGVVKWGLNGAISQITGSVLGVGNGTSGDTSGTMQARTFAIMGATSGSVILAVPTVAGSNTATFPAATGNVVLDSATQTLSNKTLSGATLTALLAINAQGTATAGGNFGSNVERFFNSYWNGTTAVNDLWDVFTSVGSGANPTTSTFTFTHSAGIANGFVALTDNNAATSGANFNPPGIQLNGHFWNGTASTAEQVSLTHVLGTGTNPTATLTLGHSGTSGTFAVDFTAASLFQAVTHIASSSGAYEFGSSGVATPDVFLTRNAAGTIKLGSTNGASDGTLITTNINLSGTGVVKWGLNGAISQITGSTLAVGNGTSGDTSGTMQARTFAMIGATSGSVILAVPTVAGSNTATFPAATGNVVLDSATQTLTNKTIDTSGPNTIKIAGTSLTTVTGSGSVVLATTPTIAGMNVSGDTVVSSANNIEWGSSGLLTPDLFLGRNASATLAIGSISGGTDGTLKLGTVSFGTSGAIQWNADTTISRKSLSPGVVQIGTTSANNAGTLEATIINAATGFRVASGATTGHVLRGNGTNFVDAALAAADLSNGVTGSGAVVLATSPALTTPSFSSIVNTGTLTLPTSTDTLVGRATTDTLTNKRVTPRVQTAADATSITPTSDTADVTVQTNTQVAGTLTIANPTGTPTDGQQLLIRIKSTNAQTYSFGTNYAFSTTVTAPTTLAAGKTDYIGCMWNATNSKWDVVAVDQGH